MSDPKTKPININTFISAAILGVMAWAGHTLQEVSRKVDVLEVRLIDNKQSVDDKLARHDTMIGEIRVDISRLKRSPKTP